MGLDSKRFNSPLSPEFICSICQNVFVRPVQRPSCEHIFCKECISIWLQESECCPIDRQPLTPRELTEAPRVLKSLLAALEVICDFASSGCVENITWDQLATHEKECYFNPENVSKSGASCGPGFSRMGRLPTTKGDAKGPCLCHGNEKLITDLIRENEHLKEGKERMQGIIRSQRKEVVELREELEEMRFLSEAGTELRKPVILVSSEHRDLINDLRSDGVISNSRVYEAMIFVDFKNFSGYDKREASLLANSLEKWAIHVKEGSRVVFISSFSTSFYVAICLASFVGATGTVVAFSWNQRDSEKVKKDHSFLLNSRRMKIVSETDHEKYERGYPPQGEGPFDFVIVSSITYAEKVKEQLKYGGKVLCYKDTILEKMSNGELKEMK